MWGEILSSKGLLRDEESIDKIISKITTKKLATSSFDMKNDESIMSLKRGIK